MPASHLRRLPLSVLALAALLSACGGGHEPAGTDGVSRAANAATTADAASPADGRAQILKGGVCTGSCTGGGGTPVAGVNPLPTTAPAPDVLVRESFGPGPAGVRPKGGNGDLRSTFIGTTLGGFWVEWPGKKNNAWITPAGEATWKFTAASSGGPNPNPNEVLPSPLEVATVYGQVWADLSDGVTGNYPTALLPVTLPTTPWVLSMDAVTSHLVGSPVMLGLTNSGATLGNLATVASVTLLVRSTAGGATLDWELWRAGSPRVLLASGTAEDMGFNQLSLAYNPASQQLQARVNGVSSGNHTLALGAIRYVGFEGNGTVDNFVLRKASAASF